jgi:hypothetical protein
MSWDRYALAVVAVTGAVFVLPGVAIAAAVYAGRRVRNQRARSNR